MGGQSVAEIPCGPGKDVLAVTANPTLVDGSCMTLAILALTAYDAVAGTPRGKILLIR